jgi:trigger factor
MKSQITRLEDGTIQLNISIPWDKVEKTRTGLVQNLSKSAKIPGFRKGKAPQKLVDDNVNEGQCRKESSKHFSLRHILQPLKSTKSTQFLIPKSMLKLDDNEDWTYTLTCEMPEIKLGEYKKEVAKITKKSKIITSKINLLEILRLILKKS